jgi:hypothetical protein
MTATWAEKEMAMGKSYQKGAAQLLVLLAPDGNEDHQSGFSRLGDGDADKRLSFVSRHGLQASHLSKTMSRHEKSKRCQKLQPWMNTQESNQID